MSACSFHNRETEQSHSNKMTRGRCAQKRVLGFEDRSPHRHSSLFVLQRFLVLLASIYPILSLSLVNEAAASCFLSYDSASALPQGDALVRISFQGGTEGLGSTLESRLGLLGDRELHLRSGGCQWDSLWGWGLEAGINQEWLTVEETGLVDLAFRVSATIFLADDQEDAYSSVGLVPVFLISLPFHLSGDSSHEDQSRKGFVGISLGMSIDAVDQRALDTIEEGENKQEELRMSSDLEWQPLISLSAAVDVIAHTPLSLEVRWQRGGLYGGAALSYLF